MTDHLMWKFVRHYLTDHLGWKSVRHYLTDHLRWKFVRQIGRTTEGGSSFAKLLESCVSVEPISPEYNSPATVAEGRSSA